MMRIRRAAKTDAGAIGRVHVETWQAAYAGILPDLFKEGKGVVAQGKIGADGKFVATEVLAKHDENYMPPEAKDALEKAQQTMKTLK